MILEGKKGPLVVAHRGSSGSAPENTMAAFRMAAEAGADMIEFDVRMTRDCQLVVHHDRVLGRTSNGRGRVSDLTLREMKAIDAGSWYSRLHRGERVPTLREVLVGLPRTLGMNIEVKTDRDRRGGVVFEETLVLLLKENSRAGTVLVSSFNHRFLRRLRAVDPSVHTGTLYMPVRDRVYSAARLAGRARASAFICSRTQLRERYVRSAHRSGVAVAVYGIQTRDHLAAACRREVDAVITNYPERMLRALGR